MAKGTKRASPGAEAEKSPLQNIELSDEHAKNLQAVQRDIARAELILERHAQMKLIPVYEKRRQVIHSIPKFWPVALMNHTVLAYHIQHTADQLALSYLEDVWVARDSAEPRCYTVEFHFKENPHFTDKVLKKEFKYVPPPAAADDKPDADGITESMLDFSWERDVVVSVRDILRMYKALNDVERQGTKINWKEPSKALTKLYPRETGEEEDDMPVDPGSFFNFFEHDADPSEIGLTIGNEIFPEAIDYFLGNVGGDVDSDEDEEEEEDDDDDDDDEAEEIDLEKPRTKKQKV